MIVVRFSDTFPLRRSEWMLAFVMVGLGVVWTTSPHLFESHYFEPMTRLWPQTTWAILAILIAVGRLTFLVINGFFRASPHMRCLGAVASSLIWLQLSFCAMSFELVGQGTAMWPVFVIFDAFAAFTAASEARTSDDRARAKREDAVADGSPAH